MYSPQSTSPSISVTPCFQAPPSAPSHSFAPSTFLMIQAASSGVSSAVSYQVTRSNLLRSMPTSTMRPLPIELIVCPSTGISYSEELFSSPATEALRTRCTTALILMTRRIKRKVGRHGHLLL